MNLETYNDVYRHLIFDLRMDTDEAQCVMTDLEMDLEENPELDVWDLVEELFV